MRELKQKQIMKYYKAINGRDKAQLLFIHHRVNRMDDRELNEKIEKLSTQYRLMRNNNYVK